MRVAVLFCGKDCLYRHNGSFVKKEVEFDFIIERPLSAAANKIVEFDFVGARTLSKEDSPKNEGKFDAEESEFSDVQTGHCKLDTGHKVKEIGQLCPKKRALPPDFA